jgi:hypothetical protein
MKQDEQALICFVTSSMFKFVILCPISTFWLLDKTHPLEQEQVQEYTAFEQTSTLLLFLNLKLIGHISQ